MKEPQSKLKDYWEEAELCEDNNNGAGNKKQ